jgi:hypothetical protein
MAQVEGSEVFVFMEAFSDTNAGLRGYGRLLQAKCFKRAVFESTPYCSNTILSHVETLIEPKRAKRMWAI